MPTTSTAIAAAASLYKDNSRKPSTDFGKPPFGHKSNSLQKLLADANKTTERATRFIKRMITSSTKKDENEGWKIRGNNNTYQ